METDQQRLQQLYDKLCELNRGEEKMKATCWIFLSGCLTFPNAWAVWLCDSNIQQKVEQGGSTVINRGENIVISNTCSVSEKRLEALSEEFGVTKSAIKSFFKILEQQAVPLEDLDKTLRDIANRYKEMLKNIQSLESADDPQVIQLLKQVQQFLAGKNAEGKDIPIDFDQAEKALKLAFEREKEAIQKLEKVEKIKTKKDKKRLSAVGIKAQEAELNFTRLRYLAAGEAYQEAAELLPEGYEKELGQCLNWVGFAFYQAGQYDKALPLFQ